MKGDIIPDSDHVGRYCKPSTIVDGQIQASAFMLRENEHHLSVNWLEYLNCKDREEEIKELIKIYSNKLKIRLNSKIAVLNVGIIRKKVFEESPDNRNLEFVHDPQPNDPSHSEILNLKEDNEFIAELIIESIIETYPVKR